MEALTGIIRYGVIDSSCFGTELICIMNTKRGTQVRAVYNPENGDTVVTELGCDTEDSLESLVSRKNIQAVIVATPDCLHKEPVLAAAEHGLHVFCEKPIALNFEDCQEMVDACQENHVVPIAGHVVNFFRGVRGAKKLIGQGVVGSILYHHGACNAWKGTGASKTWKKTRSKSGGHLYHHIHGLDCVQFPMGDCPEAVTMTGDDVAHRDDRFGDKDDMLFITMEYPGGRYAVLGCGSAFCWQEHYLLIQGAMGAIKIDIYNYGMTLKTEQKKERFLVHRTKEEGDDGTRIYRETERGDDSQFGRLGRKPSLWLRGITDGEIESLNNVLHNVRVTDEFLPLFTGEIARNSIVAADACTLSLREDRKVEFSGIVK